MGFFLCLRGTTWHYRKAVPDDLRPYVGKREIKKTLQTGNKLEAQRRSMIVGDKVQTAINRARMIAMSTELTEIEKEEIIKGLFNWLVGGYDSHLDDACNPVEQDFSFIREVTRERGIDVESTIKHLRNIEDYWLKSSLEDHQNRNFQPVTDQVKNSAHAYDQGLPEGALTGSFLNALSLARIEAYKLIHARKQGENPPVPDRYKFAGHPFPADPLSFTTPLIQTTVPVAPTPPAMPSVRLTEVIELQANDRRAAGKWTDKTEQENRALYQNFLDFAGVGITCAEIDYHLVVAYRDALKKLPSNRNKAKKYKNKSIHEILEMDVDNPMSTSTVNKNLNRLSTLLHFAVKLDYMTKNPAQGMEIIIDQKDSEQRDAFTTEDLQKLFDSPQYHDDSFKEPFMFWVLPIALFTGMRQTEIAQLHLSDIYEKDGIWTIDVNDDAQTKKVKTKNARRLVPLHPFLAEELNLPAYAKSLREQGQKRLFPELEHHRDGYGQKISRWFNGHGDGKSTGYKVSCGVKGKNKVFHSFRHTLINHLKQKLVDLAMLHEFDGHSFKSQTMGRYGKDYENKLMYDEIVCKITFDKELKLDHLLKSKYILD